MPDKPENTDTFAHFFLEKLRPEIDKVNLGRKSALWRSLLVGAGTFILFFLIIYILLTPYYHLLADYEITYVPLMVLLPLTMAVIGFSLVYIMSLRSVVRNFRETMVSKFAQFIDPDMGHQPDTPFSEETLRQSLLFENLGTPEAGPDRFLGRRGIASYEAAELRLVETNKGRQEGIFYTAKFDRRFPALLVVLTADKPISLSGMEAKLAVAGIQHGDELVRLEVPGYPLQLITRPRDQETAQKLLAAVFTPELLMYCHQRQLDPYLSCIGDRLSIALVQSIPGQTKDRQPVFDTFDFARCRDFCNDFAMCLGVSDELARNMALWEAKVN